VKRPLIPPSVASPTPSPTVPAAKKRATIRNLDLGAWEHEAVGTILKVTLNVCVWPFVKVLFNLTGPQKSVAEQSGYELVWLKSLAEELASEGPGSCPSSLEYCPYKSTFCRATPYEG
jgi:ubiquitin conjugation factor E4 B